MRKFTPALKTIRAAPLELLGVATVAGEVLVVIALAGLAFSAVTGSPMNPLEYIKVGDRATVTEASGVPPPLSTLVVPLPGKLDDFVKDEAAATRLGKALFWDTQVGGDGQTACATCHFSAGVDARVINTVHPGPDGNFDIAGITAPGQTLTAAAFPFGQDPNIDDIVGSQGVVRSTFERIDEGKAEDVCSDDPASDLIFHPDRQVTGRNAPNMIMAIFNRENFWDGRANEVFNGVNVTNADPVPPIMVDDGAELQEETIALHPSSQASQEVGPPNNEVEMSCAGRTFPELGRKLLSLTPLGQQEVDSDDSVLGFLSNSPANALDTTYEDMIEAAFQNRFWDSAETILLPAENGAITDDFSLMENNFSLFWGLAIMLYGSTLIPDDTPFDHFAEAGQVPLPGEFEQQEVDGLELFMGEARCSSCHGGSTFGSTVAGSPFANTGVRPTAEDLGRGDGEFKTPTIRNAEITGPYFHNGGKLTLRQVVDFYDQGGDFDNPEKNSQVRPLGLTDAQKDALVAFMLALTDERVRCESAPFDHPSINVPNFGPVTAVGAGGRAAADCIKPFLDVKSIPDPGLDHLDP